MTKEQLKEILSKVYGREWSPDDAHDAIWGESFDGYTQPIDLWAHDAIRSESFDV